MRARSDGSALDLPAIIIGASFVLWTCGEIGAWAAVGFGEPDGAGPGRAIAAVAGPLFWIGIAIAVMVAVRTRRCAGTRQRGEGA